MPDFHHPCLPLLEELSQRALTVVSRVLRELPVEERSYAIGHAGSDVIYRIDREVEEQMVTTLTAKAEALGGIVLIAEGIGEEETSVYPTDWKPETCAWRMLADPIDGTRGIMMDKRSGWFLAGVAPNHGVQTHLQHIECAVMMELPTTRAAVADRFTAVRGQGVEGWRFSLVTDHAPVPVDVAPASQASIRGGFAQFSRFFPPGREDMAALEEEVIQVLFPDAAPGEILCFEDQYIASGGQLAELIRGHDRFTADLRACLYASDRFADKRIGHVCHPYDLAAVLVAEEAGVLVKNEVGQPLDAPLDTRTAVNWIGYANPAIRSEVEPVLLAALRKRGWIASENGSPSDASKSD